MNGNVVVVPAQGGEVVRVVATAVTALPDVVGLEPVAARARIDCAAAVAPGNGTTNSGWDCLGRVRGHDRSTVCETDDLHRSIAKQLVEGVGTDAWSIFDLGPKPSAGAVGPVEIDEDRHRRARGIDLLFAGPVHRVLGHGDEGVGLALPLVDTFPCGRLRNSSARS